MPEIQLPTAAKQDEILNQFQNLKTASLMDADGKTMKPHTQDSLNLVRVISDSIPSIEKDFKFSDDGKYVYIYTVKADIYSINLETLEVKVFDYTQIPIPTSTTISTKPTVTNYSLFSISGDFLFFYTTGFVCKVNRFTMQLVSSASVGISQTVINPSSIAVTNDYVYFFALYSASGVRSTKVVIFKKSDLSIYTATTDFLDLNNISPIAPMNSISYNNTIYLFAGELDSAKCYKIVAGAIKASAASQSLSVGINSVKGKGFIVNDTQNIYLLNCAIAIDIQTLAIKVNSTIFNIGYSSLQKVGDKYFLTEKNGYKSTLGSVLHSIDAPDMSKTYQVEPNYFKLISQSTEPLPIPAQFIIYLSDKQYLICTDTQLALYKKTKNIIAWRVVE